MTQAKINAVKAAFNNSFNENQNKDSKNAALIAFSRALAKARTLDFKDDSLLFNLLHEKVVAGKLELDLDAVLTLNVNPALAKMLPAITEKDWLPVVEKVFAYLKKHAEGAEITHLEVKIPYALTAASAKQLSKTLEDFFKHLPKGVKTVDLQLAANSELLSKDAMHALIKAAAKSVIVKTNIKLSDAQQKEYDSLKNSKTFGERLSGAFKKEEEHALITPSVGLVHG